MDIEGNKRKASFKLAFLKLVLISLPCWLELRCSVSLLQLCVFLNKVSPLSNSRNEAGIRSIVVSLLHNATERKINRTYYTALESMSFICKLINKTSNRWSSVCQLRRFLQSVRQGYYKRRNSKNNAVLSRHESSKNSTCWLTYNGISQ